MFAHNAWVPTLQVQSRVYPVRQVSGCLADAKQSRALSGRFAAEARQSCPSAAPGCGVRSIGREKLSTNGLLPRAAHRFQSANSGCPPARRSVIRPSPVRRKAVAHGFLPPPGRRAYKRSLSPPAEAVLATRRLRHPHERLLEWDASHHIAPHGDDVLLESRFHLKPLCCLF